MKNSISALAFAALLMPAAVHAQDASTYPDRPVELIVGFPAGGATDLFARVTAEALQQALGQPVVVINKPGAGGMLAAQEVIGAEPDGYTLLMASPALTTAPFLQQQVPFDPVTALDPAGLVVSGSSVFVMHKDVPVQTFDELIAYATEHPGEVSYASTGVGSTNHLILEYISDTLGIELTHVPYGGGAAVVAALSSGEAKSTVIDLGNAGSLIDAGTVRVLAQLGVERSARFSEIETFDERLIPGFTSPYWLGVAAPAGTDPAIIEKLNAAINVLAASPELKERAEASGLEASGGTAEEFAALIESESTLWKSVIEANGIAVQ